MFIQYVGKKPKLIYDPPWLVGGPYVFDKDVDSAVCDVDPVDAADMLKYNPMAFVGTPEPLVAAPPPDVPPAPPEPEQTADTPAEGAPDPEVPPETAAEVSEPPAETPETPESKEEPEAGAPEAGAPNPFTCLMCGATLSSAANLKRHMKRVHNVEEGE